MKKNFNMQLRASAGIIVLAFLVLASNSYGVSSDSSPMDKLADNGTKLWKYVSMSRGGSDITLSECMKEDFLAFNKDGTGVLVFGEYHCDPNSTTTNDWFNYTIEDNASKIYATNLHPIGGEEEELTVIELNEDKLVYEAADEVDGITLITRYTLVPVVVEDLASIPTALAGNGSKIWKWQSIQVDGEDISIPVCQQDELVFYNKDGTGIYAFGEADCVSAEQNISNKLAGYVTSDHFTYEVSDDGKKIIGHNLNSVEGSSEEMTVLELTNSIFKFESKEGLPGNEMIVTSTMVPVVN